MDVASYDLLKLDVSEDGRCVFLSFEHGKANEVGTAVLAELERLVHDLAEDPEVVCLVTTSRRVSRRGTPIFVAGADVSERGGWTDDQVKAHVRWQSGVLRSLRESPVFHVVVVGGVALGWGTEYLLTADFRIATPKARFGLPETGLGILPGAGGSSELWTEIGVAQTLRLGMTGEQIDADEAAAMGLVQEVVPDLETGLARARSLAERVKTRSPTAIAAFKRAVLSCTGAPGPVRGDLEMAAYERCVDSGEAAIGREHFNGIRAGERPPWGPKRGG